MTATDVARIARKCGITSNHVEPHQLLRFAELVEGEERTRCLSWVEEVADVLRYSISKISKTLSQHIDKKEPHND